MKKLWFRTKTYGWGWTPATWQGWLVIAVYVLFVVVILQQLDTVTHSASDTFYEVVLPLVFVTAALIGVCIKTGEKPRWRWGGK